MATHVSDSEDDIYIPISSISVDRFRDYLNNASEISRQLIEEKLRESRYYNLLDRLIQQNHLNEIENENQEIQTALLSILPLSNLRRGLRKRNFASTHPYLADQAHWLDLASIDYLNDIYELNQDLPAMLKMLNHQYMKKKTKYPNEDRYKSRSFYSFLGRTNPNNMMYITNPSQSSQYDDQLHVDLLNDPPNNTDSNYESEVSIKVHRHHGGMIQGSDEEGYRSHVTSDDDLSTNSLESSSEINIKTSKFKNKEGEDQFIRVGGRYMKEKSVLKGVLPESAKRLEIYRGKESSIKKKNRLKEKRKGLAVKKMKYDKSFMNEADLYKSIIDNQSDESDHYVPFLQQNIDNFIHESKAESSVFDAKYNGYISDTESDSDSPVEIEWEKIVYKEAPTYFHDQKEINPDMVKSVTQRKHRRLIKRQNTLKTKSFRTVYGGFKRLQNSSTRKRAEEIISRTQNQSYRESHGISRMLDTFRNSSNSKDPSNNNKINGKTDSDKLSENETEDQNNHDNIKDRHLYKYQPDLTNYRFRRNPISSTTSIEAESNTNFVKFNNYISRDNNSKPHRDSDFQGIDLQQLSRLNEYYVRFEVPKTLVAILNEHKYTFDLVNKHDSILHCSNLLLKIAKLVNEAHILKETTFAITKCCVVLIQWYLTIQELPGETEWKYLKIILNSLVKRNSEDLDGLFPYLLVLYFIFWKLGERYKSLSDLETEFVSYCSYYWKKLFEKLSEEDQVSSKSEESFEFIWNLIKFNSSLIWKSIDACIDNKGNKSIFLTGFFFVAQKLESQHYNWTCFYKLYDLYKESNVKFHREFIDVCFLLNQQKSWPLQEKLILKIYSNVTRNKFYNFKDEPLLLNSISKIRTFNDIPDMTFFDCFLQLVYYYVSGLESELAVKKLATKLLISSQFQYEGGKENQVAFMNRFNFIILLAQISSIDQNNLVIQLFRRIVDVEDIVIFLLGIKQLKIYNEIMLEREVIKLPFECFGMLINKCSQLYMKVAGSSKLVVQLNICMMSSFCFHTDTHSELSLEYLTVLELLNMKNLCDDVSIKLIDMLILACKKLGNFNGIDQHKTQAFSTKISSYLSYQMGRFPMRSRIEEMKIIKVVENCIYIWVMLTNHNGNWNKLLLQDYPYLGNSYLREKFVVYLLTKILEFNKLQQHETMIIEMVMKQLIKVTWSSYSVDIINMLKKHNHFLTNFNINCQKTEMSEVELMTNKTQIILNMVSNIRDSPLLTDAKYAIIVKILESLNEEYDKCFMSTKFMETCTKIMTFIQIQFSDVSSKESFIELANKLNITPISANQLRWKNLPEIEQLSFLHKEFVAIIIRKTDPIVLLDQYSNERFIPIFHLISIYLKEIIQDRAVFWMLVSILLDYIAMKLNQFKVDMADAEFGKFLMMLVDATKVFDARYVNRYSDVLRNYQLKTILQTCNILRFCYIAYDGYKDQDVLNRVIQQQLMDYKLPTYKKMNELSQPYSHYILYEICPNSKNLQDLNYELTVIQLEEFNIGEGFKQLELLVGDENTNSGVLEFDFSF